jgi:protein ImuB
MKWLGLCFDQSEPHAQWLETQSQIARVAYHYSDQLAWVEPATLVVEIQKSQQLYATPKALINHLTEALTPLHSAYRFGAAPNPMAAALMAKLNRRCWDQSTLIQTLDQCPTNMAKLPRRTQKSLQRCGIETLGEFNRQPTDQRIRRFGKALNHHIQQLYGQQPTLIHPWHPQDHYYHRIDLIDAISSRQRLQHNLEKASHDLKDWLTHRNRALTRFMVRCKHEQLGSTPTPDLTFDLSLAKPSFDHKHLKELLKLKIDDLPIKKPISTIIIECESTSQHTPSPNDMFNGTQHSGNWSELLDHLGTRLGWQALTGISPHPHHQPEHAWCWRPPHQVNDIDDVKHRPSWLLPEPVECRREQLTLQQGPERIETGWWDNRPCQRDYWVAREPNGRMLWVFHEHKPRIGWFIHGIFG